MADRLPNILVGATIVALLVVVAVLVGGGALGAGLCGAPPREGLRPPAGDSVGASPFIFGGRGPLPREKDPGGESHPCRCPAEEGKRRFECEETHPLCWNGRKHPTPREAQASKTRDYCDGPDSYCAAVDPGHGECAACGQDSGERDHRAAGCTCPTAPGDSRFECVEENPYCWNGAKHRHVHEARAQKEWDYCGHAQSYCRRVASGDAACLACGGSP